MESRESSPASSPHPIASSPSREGEGLLCALPPPSRDSVLCALPPPSSIYGARGRI